VFVEPKHVFADRVPEIYLDGIDDFSTRTVNRKVYGLGIFGRFVPSQLAAFDWDVFSVIMELDATQCA
jgi:hypothetical protein